MTVTVHHGDCLDVLAEMPDNSVDAVCTDPPYGLSNTDPTHVVEALTQWATGNRTYVPTGRGFMGKEWDAFVPPPAVWDQCYRVLKPGGHLLAFAGSRTFDLMTLSVRFAGFDIRDSIAWLYGSGFPKSQDVSKAIDKARDSRHEDALAVTIPMAEAMQVKGLTRRDLNLATGRGDNGAGSAQSWTTVAADGAHKPRVPTVEQWTILRDLLDLHHLDAEVWRLNGRKGTPGEAWKAREVVSERPAFGIGGNGVLSGHAEGATAKVVGESRNPAAQQWAGWGTALKPAFEPIVVARKPLEGTVAANVLAHGTGALNIDATRVGTSGGGGNGLGSHFDRLGDTEPRVKHGEDKVGSVGRWPTNVVLDGDAADALDEQSGTLTSSLRGKDYATPATNQVYGDLGTSRANPGNTYGDSGGASRFFPVFRYQAKAPTRERPSYVKDDGTKVAHPTVKPLDLMRWLVRLATPPGGTVLDPFAGSGATIEAALIEGMQPIGIERDPDYLPLIHQRITRSTLTTPTTPAARAVAQALTLFDTEEPA